MVLASTTLCIVPPRVLARSICPAPSGILWKTRRTAKRSFRGFRGRQAPGRDWALRPPHSPASPRDMIARSAAAILLLASTARPALSFAARPPTFLRTAATSTSTSISMSSSKPISIIVEADIKPDRMEEFLDLIQKNAEGSRKEPGCQRFGEFWPAEGGVSSPVPSLSPPRPCPPPSLYLEKPPTLTCPPQNHVSQSFVPASPADVLRSQDDENKFFFYEVYVSRRILPANCRAVPCRRRP